MSDAAVRAVGLAVGWGSHVVVDRVDVEVPAGTSLALVGTNGSGKSTLLRTIAGLIPALGGELEVLGGRPGTQPARVAYLGQFHPRGFVLPLRARDVVAMGRYPSRGLLGRPARGDDARIDAAMERMRIGHLARRPLRDLSGGQQQRVYIAQALAWEADLVVLDEPGSGLDPGAHELLRDVVRAERARGAAVITATHDIRDAAACDQALLVAGRVVAAGPAAEVITPDAVAATFGLVLTDGSGDMVVPVDAHHCGHDHAGGPAPDGLA